MLRKLLERVRGEWRGGGGVVLGGGAAKREEGDEEGEDEEGLVVLLDQGAAEVSERGSEGVREGGSE
jgi:hypothetical protein